MLKGAKWFASIGTEKTKGTKVFCLAGKINNTGVAELPYGTTLREMIFEVGGGIPNGKKFKAVQTGGPSGGVIPEQHIDEPIDYESLQKLGSIMGSGGLVVMDEDSCMVDVARFFLEFCCDESCGKCPPCRVGTRQMLNILDRISKGEGEPDDIGKLQDLAAMVKDTSLCGLGQTAPNPVLTTLRYFRQEYEAHIHDKRCPAQVCRDLLSFTINQEKCVGCSVCARSCPVNTIFKIKGQKKYFIVEEDCIHCGACLDTCKFDSIIKASEGPSHTAPPKPEFEPIPGRKMAVNR
jgi:NADP-reducing hydrogenase subunit HndC